MAKETNGDFEEKILDDEIKEQLPKIGYSL